MTTLKSLSIFILVISIAFVSAQDAPATAAETPTVPAPPKEQPASSPPIPPSQEVPVAQTKEATQANIQATPVEPTPKAEEVAAPSPSTPEHASATQPQHPPQVQQKIDSVREEVAKSSTLDKDYLKEKIQQVVASMTPQQREAFEQKMSAEARAAYEKYTKQAQQQANKEHQEIQKLKEEVVISKSDEIINAEAAQTQKVFDQFLDENDSTTDLTFQLPAETSQDFKFALPIDQRITVTGFTYVNTDGVYNIVTNAEDNEPIWIFVYEDRDKIVVQKSFHVRTAFSFLGKANSSYLIRCVNHGTNKLLSLHITNVLMDSHIQDKLFVEDVADHQRRIGRMRGELVERLDQKRDRATFKEVNQKKLLLGLEHYYFYNILEIVVLGIVCVVQVESVRKLLMNTSVI